YIRIGDDANMLWPLRHAPVDRTRPVEGGAVLLAVAGQHHRAATKPMCPILDKPLARRLPCRLGPPRNDDFYIHIFNIHRLQNRITGSFWDLGSGFLPY